VKKRKLKNLKVSYVSLVDKGANQKQIICKMADSGSFVKSFDIIRKDEAKKMVYGIVYAPDQVDAHGDFADAETIEKASQEFMRSLKIHNIDKQHNLEKQQAFVAENWIVRKGDELFPEETGAWAQGIKIEDEELWKACECGEITGLSLYGEAEIEEVSKEDESVLEKILKTLKGLVWEVQTQKKETVSNKQQDNKQTKMEVPMDEKTKTEVSELIKNAVDTVKTELTTEIEKLKTENETLKAKLAKSNSNNQDDPAKEVSFI
jgi:hypothetical protein